MNFKLLALILVSGVFGNIQAQMGCTDPLASNYDSNAVENDGSCLYSFTQYSLEAVVELDNDLEENSGLAFFNGNLWTINDKGGEDKIYRIDTLTGDIDKEVVIATADNTDWEDLAESPTHIFIGDFGNNDGDRTDLRIYKISKSDMEANNIINAEVINFSYADQTEFEPNNNDHDFDCEAFFYLNGNLHLFSKNWDNFKTKHYILPDDPGTYVAEVEETFNAQCLVTGADINDDGTIALISYTNTGLNIMWLLYDYSDEDFFSGNKRRINLGNALLNGQTEGIVFEENGRGFVGAERFEPTPPQIFSFKTNQWIVDGSLNTGNLPKLSNFEIFPNPFQSTLTIESQGMIKSITLSNLEGKIYYSGEINSNFYSLDTSEIPCGVYFLKVFAEDGFGVKRMVKL